MADDFTFNIKEAPRVCRHFKSAIHRLYRFFIYPWKRMALEKRTRSVLSPGSFVSRDSVLSGRNYLGKNTEIHDTLLGFGSYIQKNGDFSHADIGKYTSIGMNVTTAVGGHPFDQTAMHPAFTDPSPEMGFSYAAERTYEDETPRIKIGSDVWIGNNVTIIDGAFIGDGAVIGAGAVVKGIIPPYSICAGCPAKPVKYRFSQDVIKKLTEMRWWDRDEKWIKEHISSFRNVEDLLNEP